MANPCISDHPVGTQDENSWHAIEAGLVEVDLSRRLNLQIVTLHELLRLPVVRGKNGYRWIPFLMPHCKNLAVKGDIGFAERAIGTQRQDEERTIVAGEFIL